MSDFGDADNEPAYARKATVVLLCLLRNLGSEMFDTLNGVVQVNTALLVVLAWFRRKLAGGSYGRNSGDLLLGEPAGATAHSLFG